LPDNFFYYATTRDNCVVSVGDAKKSDLNVATVHVEFDAYPVRSATVVAM
jgi:hypothetical protein